MRFVLSLLLLSLLCTCDPAPKTADTATDETAPMEKPAFSGDWEILFDGSSTDKWRGYNKESFPTKGWRIENGELMVEHSGTEEDGFGGDIITKDKFTDFELEVEFALTDTSNSGIFYLVQEVENTPIWHSAPEYQLLDDETYKITYPSLTLAQCTGANYDMHPQEINHSHPIGEWNKARITKRGNHVAHWLNDKLVIEYDLYSDDWKARYTKSKFADYSIYAQDKPGHLGLQDHGHLCRFRNVRVRRE
ncbi:MAG: DUF1080 domain-containing protein [Lewinella sp.]